MFPTPFWLHAQMRKLYVDNNDGGNSTEDRLISAIQLARIATKVPVADFCHLWLTGIA